MSPAMSPGQIISLLVSARSPAETSVNTDALGGWETWRHGDERKKCERAFRKCLKTKACYIGRRSFRNLSLLVSRSPMYIRRRSKPKPWIAKKKGRTKPAFAGASVSSSNPLYKTAEWQSTRRAVLQRYPVCYWCEACGLLTESTDADHVQSSSSLQSRSSFFDQENIVGSCRSCNSRRASYAAKGVWFETKEEWARYLKMKMFTQ